MDDFEREMAAERRKAVILINTLIGDSTKDNDFAESFIASLLALYPITSILRVLRDRFAAIDNQVRGTEGEHRERLIESLVRRALS